MVISRDGLVDSPWQQFKDEIERTWEEVASSELNEFKEDQSALEQFLHRRTGKDMEGIQHRIDKLLEDTDYRF